MPSTDVSNIQYSVKYLLPSQHRLNLPGIGKVTKRGKICFMQSKLCINYLLTKKKRNVKKVGC